MDQWNERFPNHVLFSTLPAIHDSLNKAETEATVAADVVSIHQIRRVIDHFAGRMRIADPAFVPASMLSNVNSYLQSAAGELSAFASNKNSAHLQNATGQMDNVASQMVYLPPLTTDAVEEIEQVREAVASFRKSAGQHQRYLDDEMRNLSSSVVAIRKQLDEMVQEITSQKSRLDTAISQFQQQFSEAEARRAELFSATEREASRKHTETSETLKATSEATIDELETQTAAAIAAQKDTFATAIREFNSAAEQIRQKFENDGNTVISALGSLKTRAEELVSVITNTGNVAGFQRVADRHRSTARVWQVIAVVALLGLVTFAMVAFFAVAKGAVNWELLAARLFVSATFGILGAYAARQADKHEYAEAANRKLELELASIDPFLVGLPEDMRNETKRQLADRLFGKASEPTSAANESTATIADLLRLALQTLSEVVKKK